MLWHVVCHELYTVFFVVLPSLTVFPTWFYCIFIGQAVHLSSEWSAQNLTIKIYRSQTSYKKWDTIQKGAQPTYNQQYYSVFCLLQRTRSGDSGIASSSFSFGDEAIVHKNSIWYLLSEEKPDDVGVCQHNLFINCIIMHSNRIRFGIILIGLVWIISPKSPSETTR